MHLYIDKLISASPSMFGFDIQCILCFTVLIIYLYGRSHNTWHWHTAGQASFSTNIHFGIWHISDILTAFAKLIKVKVIIEFTSHAVSSICDLYLYGSLISWYLPVPEWYKVLMLCGCEIQAPVRDALLSSDNSCCIYITVYRLGLKSTSGTFFCC